MQRFSSKQCGACSHDPGLLYRRMFRSLIFVLCMFMDTGYSIRFLGVGESYARYSKWNACNNASVMFEFRTRQKDGLLMHTGYHGTNSHLQVAITGGAIQLRINFAQEDQNVEIVLGHNMSDGNWHQIKVERNRMETTLLVDNTQSSKVAFGSDSDEDLETSSFVYFGGVSSQYMRSLTPGAISSNVQNVPFVGEIINVLYFNCSCIPVRASVLESRGVSTQHKEACEERNPCPVDCPCISGNDGPGCSCNFRQECFKDQPTRYYLPMDSLDSDLILNPSGLDSRVYGNPQLVLGVHEMALELDGRSQWVRVSGPSHKRECFGDLDLCTTGYYIGMWLKFLATPDQKSVYMSNGAHLSNGHGIAMSYSKSGLEFVFKTKDGKEWRVEEKDILPGRWYHVAASWAKDKGLMLYINGQQVAHRQSPRQTTEVRDGGRFMDFVIGRSNDNSGTSKLTVITVDDFSFLPVFKSEEEMREEGPAFHYHLSLDEVEGDKLEAIGCNPKIYGQIQTASGKIKQGLSFSGRGEYVDLGDVSGKCLGDLEKCKQGLYMSFFIRFSRLENGRGYIFSSPLGLNVYQTGNRLVASAQRERSIWEASFNELIPGTWYFVEISWSQEGGISLYVDGSEVDRRIQETSIREPRSTHEMKAFVGRSNEGGQAGRLSNAVLDDLDIYYATRDMLSKIGYISEERPENYHFDFEDIRGGRIYHDKMSISLIGNPEQIDGKIGQALKLNGNNEAVDFGDQSSICFGNLDYCGLGALFSMWIRFDRFRNNMYFLSSGNNGIRLEYRGQKLNAIAETSTKRWETSSSSVETGIWYFVEVSFHPLQGLGLYINNELVAEDGEPTIRTDSQSQPFGTNRVYLGRANVDSGMQYADAAFDEMEMWYADRDYLTAHGYIQRGPPLNFKIDFEELVSEERLMHQVLSIRLIGGPRLVPGKVNNALELNGRGQYADLGRRGGECFSNLAKCVHGITIAAWMRFHRFENNMVFLSTGENGILMMYKDGYIQVSAGGRGVVTTPRFESGRWYFIEITWHSDSGLELFVNNELHGESDQRETTSYSHGSFYIGRPNQGDVPASRYTYGNFDIDEMEIWYGKRENLVAFGYVDRDNLGYEAFSLDNARGRQIDHTKYNVLLINGASIVPGRFGNAVLLNGRGQYVDLGTHFNRCFGNIDLCIHGLTLSLWLNPRQLRDGQTFLSTPTYNIFYKNGQLVSEFYGQRKTWTTSSSQILANEWQRITMAWHPKKGLTMYINDELVDQDRQGTSGPLRKKPASEHAYIGIRHESDKVTADTMADDLQVWYDDIDQLQSTGQYVVEVVPQSITFNNFENNFMRIHGREVHGYGDIQLVQGKGQDMKAIYLAGSSGYLDLGKNFTCGGDLDKCQRGVTLRLGLNPATLVDGMVFFDSFPLKLYYKDGRLYGQLQTTTQVWTVDTANFKPGLWQRVELTWHPYEGLTMFIDGQRVDYQTYPDEQTPPATFDWNTNVGRSTKGGKTYVNARIDNIEVTPAYKNFISEDSYMNIQPHITVRPPYTGEGNFKTDSPQRVTVRPQTKEVKIANFNGKAFVQFSLSKLPSEYLQPADTEEFQFYFLTSQPNGLIWMHEHSNRKMYLAMKDGQLVFVNEENNRSPDKIAIGKRDGVRFDDGKWYLCRISRIGRKIMLTVDNRYNEEYTFPRDVQFLTHGTVFLGGTQDSVSTTRDLAVPNFIGGLAQIFYQSETKQGSSIFRNEVNLIAELGTVTDVIINTTDWPSDPNSISRTTRPPPATTPAPLLTAITIKEEGVYIPLTERLQLPSGGSLSFKFQTIKRDALLMFAISQTSDKNFFALEIYDGKLYLIYNFGGQSKRILLSEAEVSDGQPHEVELRFLNDQVVTRLDGQSQRIRMEAGESLPRNLGPLNIGGYHAYDYLPWHTWARTGYQGCLEDLQINGNLIDLHSLIQSPNLIGRIDRQCTPMPQQCSRLSRCINGYCTNKWGGFYCDCTATDYTGEWCQIPAWTGVFNGTTNYQMMFEPPRKYHVNDISFRFKTMVGDGLIFHTRSRNDRGFMRAELENGRMKITTNLGGQNQTFYTGDKLNDMQWHTVYIQRRGNHMVVWVDNLEQDKKVLPGEGYHLFMEDIFIGGNRPGESGLPISTKNFTGYIRNIRFGDLDIFHEMSTKGQGTFYQEPNVPSVIFYDVTLTNFDAHARLPAIGLASGLNLYIMFKTVDPNGVILFNEGRSNEMLAVELFEGRLHLKFNIPGRPPLHMATPGNMKFNDGKWHSVSVLHQKVKDQEQLSMAVDGLHSSYSYSGIDQLNLQGPLYIGGLPDTVFQKQQVREFLSSRTGYRGCLASLNLGSIPYNLLDYSQGTGILGTCQDIRTQCTESTCKNGGICHDYLNNGTTWCDCSKTAFAGPACEDEPLGYYFRSEGDPNTYGMLTNRYTYLESDTDEIVLGVMTDERNAVLTKLLSGLFNDFIEIKLVNGYPVVTYDTNGQGASTTITSDVLVSDGRYHVIKFVRTKDNGTLFVDNGINVNTHIIPHGVFDRLNKVFVGGVYQGGKIVNGTGFHGIIGGLYVNGQQIFPYVKENKNTDRYGDVVMAPHPFKLGPIRPTPAPPIWITEPTIPPVTMHPDIIPILPADIGGGGLAWEGTPGDGRMITVWSFPDPSGGSSLVVPPDGRLISPDGVVGAQVAVVPSLPATGPRAGAVMGTILGLAALASSLMWAFYRCKPGWCACIRDPAATSLNISSPEAVPLTSVPPPKLGSLPPTDFNDGLKASQNQGLGAGGGGGAGANGGSTNVYISNQKTFNSHQHTDSFDSSTLRATGMFSNRGTGIGTPRSGRHQMASTLTREGYESSALITPASLQSYHFEGVDNQPDYDLATGVHPSYQSSTLNVSGGGGGGFSTSTMSSSYNYSVKTIRTVGGQQQMMGYASGSNSNVIVTPGAMGEEIRVDCCLMTGDGHSVVTGSSLGPPQVWNMSNGELLRIMQGDIVGSTNLHLVCNDRLLVGAINADLEINQYSVPKGVHNYLFQIWDFASGRPLGMVDPETCSALTMLSDNEKVVFGRTDKFGGGTNIIIWDLLGNQPIKEMRYDAPVGNNDYINYISLSQNDRYVIAGFTNTFDNFAEFIVFDMTRTSFSVSDPSTLRLHANPECTAILPQDEAVTGLRNGDLVVWSLRSGEPSRQLVSNTGKHAHSREVKALARSEDNKFLVSASADGTLKLWDLESERHLYTMSGHNDEVWCVAISADNEIIVSGSRDGTIRLWQLRSGREVCSFNAGVDVFYITMSHDKGTIVALGDKFGARKLIMLQVVRSKVKRQVLA